MACRVVGISDSVYRYQPDKARDDKVIAKLQEAVERYPAYGFSKLFKILKRWVTAGTISVYIAFTVS